MTEAKRMSAAELDEMRRLNKPMNDFCKSRGYRDSVSELLDHVAIVETELEAARATALDEAARKIGLMISKGAIRSSQVADAIRALKERQP